MDNKELKLDNKELKQFYDKEGIDKFRYGKKGDTEDIYHQLRLYQILRTIKDIKEKRICDIGSGDGVIIRNLKNNFSYRISCDISKTYLHRNLEADDRIVCTWDMPPFKDKSIEVVTAFDVLEHIIDFENGIKKCGNTAKNYVIISIPLDGWHRKLARLLKIDIESRDKSIGHIHVYNYNKAKYIVMKSLKNYSLINEKFIYATPKLLVKGIPIKLIDKFNQLLMMGRFPGMQWVIWIFKSYE